jgi:HD-like signal output (HDOD) protein
MNKEMIQAIKKIKPLSPRVVDLLKLASREGHGISDVVRIVECDAVLTAGILRVANSASYRPARGDVDSLQVAISLLGERTVVGICLELCSNGFFDQPLEGYESTGGELWRHDLKTAILSRLLTRHARKPIHANHAFIAGILHDIGKTVVSTYLKGSAPQLTLLVDRSNEHMSYLEAERHKLGYDHCEAGKILAEQWKLPEFCLETIAFHHHPDEAAKEYASLVFCVHLADLLAMMTGSGTGSDSMLYQLHPKYVDHFVISSEKTQLLILDAEEEFAEMISSTMG